MRPITISDLDLVVRHREEMFREMGFSEPDLAAMTAGFRPWLEPRPQDGRYFGWLCLEAGCPAAGVGMIVLDWAPPHPCNPAAAPRIYFLNVFTERAHRGKGYASALMELARDETKNRGIDFMVLHASPQGRPLYEKLGWKQTSEMSIAI